MLSRDQYVSTVYSLEEIVGLAASAANQSKNWRTHVQAGAMYRSSGTIFFLRFRARLLFFGHFRAQFFFHRF